MSNIKNLRLREKMCILLNDLIKKNKKLILTNESLPKLYETDLFLKKYSI